MTFYSGAFFWQALYNFVYSERQSGFEVNAQRYEQLMAAVKDPADLATLAFAGVISMAEQRPAAYALPIAGMDRSEFARLLSRYFPHLANAEALIAAIPAQGWKDSGAIDEFTDLVNLLGEHANVRSDECRWVALALATASMGSNHLWQDMGLPERSVLSRLIEAHFGSLFARNVGDMKWKKFFYRQLCEQAEVLICKSPSCGECVDHDICFGKEEAAEPGYFKLEERRDAR